MSLEGFITLAGWTPRIRSSLSEVVCCAWHDGCDMTAWFKVLSKTGWNKDPALSWTIIQPRRHLRGFVDWHFGLLLNWKRDSAWSNQMKGCLNFSALTVIEGGTAQTRKLFLNNFNPLSTWMGLRFESNSNTELCLRFWLTLENPVLNCWWLIIRADLRFASVDWIFPQSN